MLIARGLGILLALLALPLAGQAHRLDEYLQATLVSIGPSEVRLQMNFTPGVAVAERVLSWIDRNRDGMISTNEAAAYAELVQRQLVLVVDHEKVALKVSASTFPAPTELRTGWGFIQMEFTATIGPLAPGAHKLTLKNRHLPRLSVYLFNAAQPKSGLVRIIKQTRNRTQSTGSIEFVVNR